MWAFLCCRYVRPRTVVQPRPDTTLMVRLVCACVCACAPALVVRTVHRDGAPNSLLCAAPFFWCRRAGRRLAAGVDDALRVLLRVDGAVIGRPGDNQRARCARTHAAHAHTHAARTTMAPFRTRNEAQGCRRLECPGRPATRALPRGPVPHGPRWTRAYPCLRSTGPWPGTALGGPRRPHGGTRRLSSAIIWLESTGQAGVYARPRSLYCLLRTFASLRWRGGAPGPLALLSVSADVCALIRFPGKPSPFAN